MNQDLETLACSVKAADLHQKNVLLASTKTFS
jgi:hypothetical protein